MEANMLAGRWEWH